MSIPKLPPEMLDHIVGFLRHDKKALRECCLISKSWVPRTREHLFALIPFDKEGNLKRWKETFLDPKNSPAHHARTLTIGVLEDKEETSCLQVFSRIEVLGVYPPGWSNSRSIGVRNRRIISLIPFHNFGTSLKTIEVIATPLPLSEIISIIPLLPFLEDLIFNGEAISTGPHGQPTASTPVPSTALTGILRLSVCKLISRSLDYFLKLPGGLRFRELDLSWLFARDLPWVTELVTACSDTLERLEVRGYIDADEYVRSPLDLSKATTLKHATFRCESLYCGWVVTTLQTIKPEHRDLRKVTIHLPHPRSSEEMVGEVETAKPGMRWSDLDRLLVRLDKSRSTSSEVTFDGAQEEDWARYLLPETMKRLHPKV